MIRTCWLFSLLLLSAPELVIAHGEDDPMLIAVYADDVEWRDTNEGDSFSWDAQGWVGKDLNKFWWKTEGATHKGSVEDAELQLLYSRAMTTHWNFNVGVRTDPEPASGRDWAVVGIQGLAPYFFEIDATLFFGSSGQVAARLKAEYEFMVTQKLTNHGSDGDCLGFATPADDLCAYRSEPSQPDRKRRGGVG